MTGPLTWDTKDILCMISILWCRVVDLDNLSFLCTVIKFGSWVYEVIECQDRIILSRYHESQYSSKLCSKKSLAKVDQIVRERVLHGTLIMSMTYWDSILVWHLDYTRYMELGLLKDEGLKSHGICWQKGPLVWVTYNVWGSWHSCLVRSMIDVQMS